MARIYDIPYGIKDDTWKVAEVKVEQETIGSLPKCYLIWYHDIVKVIIFLLSYSPFAHYLLFVPVRQFSGTGNDNQIYNEIYTAN